MQGTGCRPPSYGRAIGTRRDDEAEMQAASNQRLFGNDSRRELGRSGQAARSTAVSHHPSSSASHAPSHSHCHCHLQCHSLAHSFPEPSPSVWPGHGCGFPPSPPGPRTPPASQVHFPPTPRPMPSGVQAAVASVADSDKCPAAGVEADRENRRRLHKTKLCPYLIRSGCSLTAKECRFAHDESELRPEPNLTRTKICPWLRRLQPCPTPARCPYAHDRAELRSTQMLPTHKTLMCFFFEKQRCLNGDKCR
eukprot:GHVT01040220.1.p1 GENE.GHVT01040220.1~~GHVT01040220.1.p1  ORF type:complete len:251 (+),score=42.19 GHVT01040220.1:1215-1967(+)